MLKNKLLASTKGGKQMYLDNWGFHGFKKNYKSAAKLSYCQ